MKKLIEVFNKEEQVPYLLLAFLIIQACMIMLSFFGIGYGGVGVFYVAFSNGLSGQTDFILSLIINGLILGLTIFAIITAIKHDRSLSRKKKDERELLHDQIVAVSGYRVSIVGIVLYLILFADPLIILLLLAILTARFFTRIKLAAD